ncbi:putative O-methyltransferase [Gammaproteobacteria bacterium]
MKPPIFHRMFNYNRGLLPNRHLAALEEGVASIEQARLKTGATIGYPGWGLIYHLLLSHLDRGKHEIIVETGTNWGCTTILLAQALIDAQCQGHVLTFEINQANIEKARHNFALAGVSERIEIHAGDSTECLPEALANYSGIRVALLDASHLYNDVMREFEIIFPKLADDALVIFDNTYKIAEDNEDQRVNGALKTIQKGFGGNLINLEFVSWYTPGLAIYQRAAVL